MYIAPICTPVPRLGFSQCVPLTGDIKVGRQSEVSLPGSGAGATSDDGHLGGGRRVAGQGTAHTGRGRGWVGGGRLWAVSNVGTGDRRHQDPLGISPGVGPTSAPLD